MPLRSTIQKLTYFHFSISLFDRTTVPPPYYDYGDYDYSDKSSKMSMKSGMSMMSSMMSMKSGSSSSMMSMKSGSSSSSGKSGSDKSSVDDYSYQPPYGDGTCCTKWMVKCHQAKVGSSKMKSSKGYGLEEICEPYCAIPCEDDYEDDYDGYYEDYSDYYDDNLPSTCSHVSTTNNLGCPCQCTCCVDDGDYSPPPSYPNPAPHYPGYHVSSNKSNKSSNSGHGRQLGYGYHATALPVCQCHCEDCTPYNPPPPYYTPPTYPYPPEYKSSKYGGYFKGSKKDERTKGTKSSAKKPTYHRYPVYSTKERSSKDSKSDKNDKGKGYPLSVNHS